MNIGEIIKANRKAEGLTQAELAELVGVSQSTIGKYETGDNEPSFEMVEKIAKALKVRGGILGMAHVVAIKEKAMSQHKRNGYRVGEIAQLLNEEYPDGSDWSFADYSYFDAMDAAINSLCLECGYLLEIIDAPTEAGEAPRTYYRIFNDKSDITVSSSEIHALWDHMTDHMKIDFQSFINEHDPDYLKDEIEALTKDHGEEN